MKKCKTFFCLVSIMSCSTLFVPKLFGSCLVSQKVSQILNLAGMYWWLYELVNPSTEYQQQHTVYCLSGYLSPECCVPGYHIAVYLLIPHPFDIYGATIGIIPSHKYFSWLPLPNGMFLKELSKLDQVISVCQPGIKLHIPPRWK